MSTLPQFIRAALENGAELCVEKNEARMWWSQFPMKTARGKTPDEAISALESLLEDDATDETEC